MRVEMTPSSANEVGDVESPLCGACARVLEPVAVTLRFLPAHRSITLPAEVVITVTIAGAPENGVTTAIPARRDRARGIVALVDGANVDNGSKAIDQWLAANWSEEMSRRFGRRPSSHTIKRWRTPAGRKRLRQTR